MNNNKYLEDSSRTDLNAFGYAELRDDLSTQKLQLIHAALGMSGEVGEVVEIVKKSLMYDKPYSKEDIEKECGDVLWYMGVMLRAVDSDFNTVMQKNIDKLAKRFPHKFSKGDALNRADEGK